MEENIGGSVRPDARQSIEVCSPADVGAVRRAAKAMAMAIGFDDNATEEIVIVGSELASNLLQHAQGGTLTLTPLANGAHAGIEIASADTGPGMADVEQALTDGFSTKTGSLGYGLGAVNRLMDTLDITSQCGRGVHLVCQRWVRPAVHRLTPYPLAFGVATRAHPKMLVNGDAFIIKKWGESALVAVIDGLGHGLRAHRAAQTARQYVESHFSQPLEAIFQGVGRACRATPGVVMALARFDCR